VGRIPFSVSSVRHAVAWIALGKIRQRFAKPHGASLSVENGIPFCRPLPICFSAHLRQGELNVNPESSLSLSGIQIRPRPQ
jgi:hypothetical protein